MTSAVEVRTQAVSPESICGGTTVPPCGWVESSLLRGDAPAATNRCQKPMGARPAVQCPGGVRWVTSECRRGCPSERDRRWRYRSPMSSPKPLLDRVRIAEARPVELQLVADVLDSASRRLLEMGIVQWPIPFPVDRVIF